MTIILIWPNMYIHCFRDCTHGYYIHPCIILVMVANKKSTDCMKKVMLNQIYEQKPMLKPIKLWTPIASHGLENNEHHVQNWGPILTVSQSHFWFIRST